MTPGFGAITTSASCAWPIGSVTTTSPPWSKPVCIEGAGRAGGAGHVSGRPPLFPFAFGAGASSAGLRTGTDATSVPCLKRSSRPGGWPVNPYTSTRTMSAGVVPSAFAAGIWNWR